MSRKRERVMVVIKLFGFLYLTRSGDDISLFKRSLQPFSKMSIFSHESWMNYVKDVLIQVQVKDVLIQSSLHKALKGNTSKMEADKWEELDLRAASAIRLCLAKNVLANVQNLSSAKEL